MVSQKKIAAPRNPPSTTRMKSTTDQALGTGGQPTDWVPTATVTLARERRRRLTHWKSTSGSESRGDRPYGFDDIAIVPSRRTRDPDDVDISWQLDAFRFPLPMMGSAMDSAISPATAVTIGKLGGLAVLNLEGLWTRYPTPSPISTRSQSSPKRRRRSACRRSTWSRSNPT